MKLKHLALLGSIVTLPFCVLKISALGFTEALQPCGIIIGRTVLGLAFVQFLSQPWGLNLGTRLKKWGVTSISADEIERNVLTGETLIQNIQNLKRHLKGGISHYAAQEFYEAEISEQLKSIGLSEPSKRNEVLSRRNENGKTALDLLVKMNHTESLEYLKNHIYTPQVISDEDIPEGLQQIPKDVVVEHQLPSQFNSHCTTEKSRTWLYDIFRERMNGMNGKEAVASPDPKKDAAATKQPISAALKQPVKVKSEPKSPLEEQKEKEAAIADKVKAAIAARAKEKAAAKKKKS